MATAVGFAKEITDLKIRIQKKTWGHRGRAEFIAMSGVGSHKQLQDQIINVGLRGQVAAKILVFPRRDNAGLIRSDDEAHEANMKELEEQDPYQQIYEHLGEEYEPAVTAADKSQIGESFIDD